MTEFIIDELTPEDLKDPCVLLAAKIALAKQLSNVASTAARGRSVIKIAEEGIKSLLKEENYSAIKAYLHRFKDDELGILSNEDDLDDKYDMVSNSYIAEGDTDIVGLMMQESNDDLDTEMDEEEYSEIKSIELGENEYIENENENEIIEDLDDEEDEDEEED